MDAALKLMENWKREQAAREVIKECRAEAHAICSEYALSVASGLVGTEMKSNGFQYRARTVNASFSVINTFIEYDNRLPAYAILTVEAHYDRLTKGGAVWAGRGTSRQIDRKFYTVPDAKLLPDQEAVEKHAAAVRESIIQTA